MAQSFVLPQGFSLGELVGIAGSDDPERLLIAVAYIAHVRTFGLGFHADTRGRDYVSEGGRRCLTDREADRLDADVEAMFQLPCDPYGVALLVWERDGLLNEVEG